MTQSRRFHLLRHQDISGVSGTGIVALGVFWPDGTASVRWLGERPSTVHWDRIADAKAVHGHGGATEIVWDDPEPGTVSVHIEVADPQAIKDAIRRSLRRGPEEAGA